MFFAYLDKEWVERGSMGWWGCVSGKKDPKAWQDHFNEWLGSLKPNTVLTVVDCHI